MSVSSNLVALGTRVGQEVKAARAAAQQYTARLSGHASVRSVTSATTAVVGETLRVNATSAAVTITPPASPSVGDAVSVVKTDASVNVVTWNGATQADSTCTFISQWAGATLVWDGTVWLVGAVNVSYSASSGGGVPSTRLVSAGTGLTGGGDLSADRTLAVSYGTTAGTACQGNDPRLSPTLLGADQVGFTRYAELASDVTVTNSTTLVNAGALNFTVSAGGTYLLWGHLRYSAPTANDAKVAFTGPAMTAVQWSMQTLDTSATTTTGSILSSSVIAIGDASTIVLGGTGASVPFPVARPAGVFKPSAAGTIQLRFAQNSPQGGTNATLYAPSFLTLERVA